MNGLKIKYFFNIFNNLKFAIFLLILIAFSSSFGSIIEQDENRTFYLEKYPSTKPIFGFLDANFILNLGLNNIYKTWWFFSLFILLGISLIHCTISRQFPLFLNSKEYFFKQKKKAFANLPFFIQIPTIYYLKEIILLKIQLFGFYIYQNNFAIYGYKGLIGRISPILVHFSLILLLIGAFIGAFKSFKSQEILPKGELFHIQNPIQIGNLASLPSLNIRVNDFWVEYEKNKIHQFYTNLSILDNYGIENIQQTISVNNPLRYKNIDFYQSDWNLLGIRIKKNDQKKIDELPLFPLINRNKSWITWIHHLEQNYSLIFDQLQNTFFLYNQDGSFLKYIHLGDPLWEDSNIHVLEILPSTGLLIKDDPSIPIIYFGFGFLMITTFLSFLPYTQLWILHLDNYSFIGATTNRGKIQTEIEFESLIRFLQKKVLLHNDSSFTNELPSSIDNSIH